MKKIGYWLINIVLVIAFIITCAGTFAEKSVGFGIATLVVIVLFILNIKRKNKSISYSKEIMELDNKYSNGNWKKIGHFENASLYVNENDKKVLINGNEYNFADVVSAELLEDGKSYTNTVATKGFGNTVIGSSGQTQYCTKLQIKVVLNSLTNSQEYITFITKRVLKSGKKYKSAYDIAQKFLSTLQVIINKNK